jgi:hypothetical protein
MFTRLCVTDHFDNSRLSCHSILSSNSLLSSYSFFRDLGHLLSCRHTCRHSSLRLFTASNLSASSTYLVLDTFLLAVIPCAPSLSPILYVLSLAAILYSSATCLHPDQLPEAFMARVRISLRISRILIMHREILLRLQPQPVRA